MLPGEGSGPLYATQQRWLEHSARLLGLVGEERLGEQIAELLDLSGLEHRQARIRYREASGPQPRGEAVVCLLLRLEPERYGRLVAAGHRAGLWGRPWWIDPRTGRRRAIRPPPTTFALSPAGRGA